MIKIATLCMHHNEIRGIADRIKCEMDANHIVDNPGPVARIVRELFGRFSIHLALEDSIVYPQIAANENSTVRETAVQFQSEMAGMKEGFEAYKRKWPGPVDIASNPQGFIDETRQILSSLENRIRREEVEFYPLIDKFGGN